MSDAVRMRARYKVSGPRLKVRLIIITEEVSVGPAALCRTVVARDDGLAWMNMPRVIAWAPVRKEAVRARLPSLRTRRLPVAFHLLDRCRAVVEPRR